MSCEHWYAELVLPPNTTPDWMAAHRAIDGLPFAVLLSWFQNSWEPDDQEEMWHEAEEAQGQDFVDVIRLILHEQLEGVRLILESGHPLVIERDICGASVWTYDCGWTGEPDYECDRWFQLGNIGIFAHAGFNPGT
jgi:hypothetical protein